MSDEDRALAELERRKQHALGVAAAPDFALEDLSTPIIVDSHDEDTPVEMPHDRRRRARPRRTVQEFAGDIKQDIRDLRATVDSSIRAELNSRGELVERIVKLEARLDAAAALDSNADELFRVRDDLTALRVTLLGADGTNGKIGTLGKAVKSADEKAERGPKFLKRAVGMALGGILGSLIPTAIYVKGVVEDAAASRASFAAELAAGKSERSVLQAQQLVLFRLVGSRHGGDRSDLTPAPIGDSK